MKDNAKMSLLCHAIDIYDASGV